MILENGNIIGLVLVFFELPVPHNPYRSWFAYRNTCAASDAVTFVQDFCHFLTLFLDYPVDPRTLRTHSNTLPASGAFFFIYKDLYHNCIIQRSYINALTK